MNTTTLIAGVLAMGIFSLSGASCSRPSESSPAAHQPDAGGPASRLPVPILDSKATPGAASATAIFAGGCFWCTEAVFEQLDGVSDVVSGYAGGSAANANYSAVSDGNTGHAEAIQITYDPSRITFGKLLQVFFATHDPTQLNRQGPDVGTQYRSAVFFSTEEQKQVARAYIDQLTAAGKFSQPIVTTLEPLTRFYTAEQYHQDYARLHPDQGYIQFHVPEKIEKLHTNFSDLLKKKDK